MYAVISIWKDSEAPVEVEVEQYGFIDIQEAEKYRSMILNTSDNNSLNPQNVQVIGYSL